MNCRLIAFVVLGLFLNSCNACLQFLGDLTRNPNTGTVHLVAEVLDNRVRVCFLDADIETQPVFLHCQDNKHSAAVTNDFKRFAYTHVPTDYRLDIDMSVRERLLGDAIRWSLSANGYC